MIRTLSNKLFMVMNAQAMSQNDASVTPSDGIWPLQMGFMRSADPMMLRCSSMTMILRGVPVLFPKRRYRIAINGMTIPTRSPMPEIGE